MGIVIGIDVGGSTTKIVGINGEQIQSPMFITATDPVTSLFGAFGKYIYDNGECLPAQLRQHPFGVAQFLFRHQQAVVPYRVSP